MPFAMGFIWMRRYDHIISDYQVKAQPQLTDLLKCVNKNMGRPKKVSKEKVDQSLPK